MSGRGVDERERERTTSGQQHAGSVGSGRGVGSTKRRSVNHDVDDEQDVSSSEEQGQGDNSRPSWETLLGLPADVWEKFLSPSKAWHKRRFEVGINDLAFVGWPVFVRDDGTWRKQKRKKHKPRADWEGGELGHYESADDIQEREKGENDDATVNASDSNNRTAAAATERKRSSTGNTAYSQNNDNDNGSRKNSETGKSTSKPPNDDGDTMTMFNVVFVVDPPLLEYSVRIREIYDNIIKKFAKALKWEQARTNYVWKETQHILHVKESAKEQRKFCVNLSLFPVSLC